MGLTSISARQALMNDAQATAGSPKPDIPTSSAAKDNFIDALLRWIPGESLALFVGLMGLFADWSTRTLVLVIAFPALLTPLWVVTHYRQIAKTTEAKRQWPYRQMIIGTLAFLAWTASVPKNAWTHISGFNSQLGTGVAIGVAAVIAAYVAFHNASDTTGKHQL